MLYIIRLSSPAIFKNVRSEMLTLHLIQFSELASLPTEQCLRGVAFDDTACAEDRDAVEIDDSVEAVGDGDNGAVFEFFTDDGLHQGVGVDVDTCGREDRLARVTKGEEVREVRAWRVSCAT